MTVLDSDGNEVDLQTGEMLSKRLEAKYPTFASIYMGKSPETGLYKVGVSNDTYRREGELKIRIYHEVKCSVDVVYRIEKRFHSMLKELGYHVRGEWFVLADSWHDEWLNLKTQADLSNWIGQKEYMIRAAQLESSRQRFNERMKRG